MTTQRQIIEHIAGVQRPVYAWRVDTWPDVEDMGPIEPPGTVISGPADATPDLLTRLERGEGNRFRLLDDDGFVYCYGRILIIKDTGDPEFDCEFAPLWDYGEGGLGATEIQYFKSGTGGGWKTL